ncbi:hypothetical protein K402DRAFT_404500 [Aulographum hederae CBS 113979]|uniref:Basic proline-rich protein n=1 Tax=Aulographum hederae CBS 113979 TaxID=1176131 RepID=A0A6G1H043_9PEZI|nr:hypothetical protein K402DRAFT_404500 [Aulographum hederae CBS 113979]
MKASFSSFEVPASTPSSRPPHDTSMSVPSVSGIVPELQHLSLAEDIHFESPAELRQSRPVAPRSSTHPMQELFPPPMAPPKPRSRSPYSRSHGRSQSASSTLSAPSMVRAHSSPSSITILGGQRSASPLRSPVRNRSPFRDELHVQLPSHFLDMTSISEDAELDLTPRSVPMGNDRTHPPVSPSLGPQHSNTFPRRRRPVSPLHQVSNAGVFGPPPPSQSPSPRLSAAKFNEAYPGELTYNRSFSSSSIPSTPTSTRSRSPSISSLETIPDTPDAEARALEEDLERLKYVQKRAEETDHTMRRNSNEDQRGRIGAGFLRDKKKRWSVCGAEKRSDLDLETIWED